MSNKASWQGALYWSWEGTLGSSNGVYRLWSSDEADTLTLGEVPSIRNPIYGQRFSNAGFIKRSTQLPNGMPGSIPISFDEDGSHLDLMMILRNHYQYSIKVTGGTNIFRAFWPEAVAEPSQGWTGFSLVRDWNVQADGLIFPQVNQWHGGVIDVLNISWSSSKPQVMIKPTMKFLSGTQGTDASGSRLTTIDTLGLVTPGFVEVYYNGTQIHPVGFEINSNMHFQDVVSPSNAGRLGFVSGAFTGEVKLQTWIDDQFYANYSSTFGDGSVGTFVFKFLGPENYGTTGHAKYGELIGTVYVALPNYSNMNLKKSNSIESVTFNMVAPTSSGYPIIWSLYTLYSAAGMPV